MQFPFHITKDFGYVLLSISSYNIYRSLVSFSLLSNYGSLCFIFARGRSLHGAGGAVKKGDITN